MNKKNTNLKDKEMFDMPTLETFKGKKYDLDSIYIDKETVDNLSDDECIVGFSSRIYNIKSNRGFWVTFAKVYKREDVQKNDSNWAFFKCPNEFQRSLREYLDNEESIKITSSDLNHGYSSHNYNHCSAFILN